MAFVAQRILITLCRAVDLPWTHDIVPVRGAWGVVEGGTSTRTVRVYHRRPPRGFDYKVCVAERVWRLGPVALAVEWAPDGGGETLVLDARQELTGDFAEVMRFAYEVQEAVLNELDADNERARAP